FLFCRPTRRAKISGSSSRAPATTTSELFKKRSSRIFPISRCPLLLIGAGHYPLLDCALPSVVHKPLFLAVVPNWPRSGVQDSVPVFGVRDLLFVGTAGDVCCLSASARRLVNMYAALVPPEVPKLSGASIAPYFTRRLPRGSMPQP